jgi:cystathionine beta-lyase/cystathionine gamma-synthase
MSNMVIQKDSKHGGYKYIRTSSDENYELSAKMKEMYGCRNALITSSGMNAISTLLHTLLLSNKGKRVNVVYSSEMYCDTSRLILYLKNIYDFAFHEFDIKNHETELLQYARAHNNKNEINILFTESCSNPNGIMIDYQTIDQIKKGSTTGVVFSSGCWIVIIDNTWLTHIGQNPLSYGCVDYVVTSLTKYYSAGNCIGGCIMTNHDDQQIDKYIRVNGLHVSPVNLKIVTDNLGGMVERMTKSSNATKYLLDRLTVLVKKYNITINHPYVSQKNVKYLQLYPSVFTMNIANVAKNKVVKILSDSTIDYITSFGGEKSRFDPYPKVEKNKSMTIRLAVGYGDDNLDTLLGEIERVLGQLVG